MPRIIGSPKNKPHSFKEKVLVLFLIGQITNVSWGTVVSLPANENIYIGYLDSSSGTTSIMLEPSGTYSSKMKNGYFAGLGSTGGLYLNQFNTSGDYIVITSDAASTAGNTTTIPTDLTTINDAASATSSYITSYNLTTDIIDSYSLPINNTTVGQLIVGGVATATNNIGMYVGDGNGDYTLGSTTTGPATSTKNCEITILGSGLSSNGSISTTGNSAISVGTSALSSSESYGIINNTSITRTDTGTVIDMTKANSTGTITITNNGTITAATGSKAIDFTGATAALSLTSSGTITGDIYTGSSTSNAINISGGSIAGNINGGTAGTTTLTTTNNPTITGAITLPATANVLNIGNTSGEPANFSTGGNITNAQTIHVYKITDATATTTNNAFTINNSVTGVSTSLTTDQYTTATVTSGATLSGSGSVINNGDLEIYSSNISMPITNNATGSVNVNSGGSISQTLTNSGTLNLNAGSTVGAAVNFNAASGVALNINSGNGISNIPTVTGAIAGYTTAIDTNNVNINGAFSTGGTISGVGNIVAYGTGTKFTVIDYITNFANFTVESGATTIVGSGGKISTSQASGVLNNYGALTLNQGGVIDVPVSFGVTNGAILTVNGNSTTAGPITKAITGYASYGGDNNTVSVVSNFATSNTITGVGNISVSGTSGSLTTFAVNNSITGVAKSFTIGTNTTTAVSGSGVSIAGNGVLTNSGALTLSSGASISMPMVFGAASGAALTINNGTVTEPITGYSGNNTVGDGNIININSSFSSDTTNGTISGVGNINVSGTGTVFTVNKAITKLSNNFNIGSGAGVVVASGGSISNGNSKGVLTNLSALTLNSGGTIDIPVALGKSTGVSLVVSGGIIDQPITGFAGTGGDNNVITINGTFSTGSTISGVGNISVSGSNTTFNVNNPISNLASGFTIGTGSAAVVNNGGNISSSSGSSWNLTNSGSLTLNPAGTISVPVAFGVASGASLTINGGTIGQPINAWSGAGVDANNINING
ncbi:MAG: hypothetical protein ABSA84_06660, partial [Gammaproteobacteria bacterium]